MTVDATDRTLAEHWDGAKWRRFATPNAAGNDNRLVALDARSPDDAWAVGSHGGPDGTEVLIEHWDGTSWSLAQTVHPGG